MNESNDKIFNLRNNYSDLLLELEEFNEILRLVNTHLINLSICKEENKILCLASNSSSFVCVLSLLMDKIANLIAEHNEVIENNKVGGQI